MSVRKVLSITQFICIAIAAVCMVIVLFEMGHTETAPLNLIITLAAIGVTAAVIGAMIQWIGIPVEEDEQEKKK